MPDLGLSTAQLASLAVLWSIAIVSATIHWSLLHKATRSRAGGLTSARPFRWGFGIWHIGMLRRSWYPDDGRIYYARILASYLVGLSATLAAFGLLVRWLVFHG